MIGRKWAAVFFITAGCSALPPEQNQQGNDALLNGDYAAALDSYRAAQVAAPDQAEYYINAANAYVADNQPEQAIAALTQALLRADETLKPHIFYNLGNIYFQQSRLPEAIQAYRQALLGNPQDEDARHNLELALRQLTLTPPADVSLPSPIPSMIATETSTTPTPEPTDSPNNAEEMSQEEAESLLDAAQRNQPVLPATTSAAPGETGQDW